MLCNPKIMVTENVASFKHERPTTFKFVNETMSTRGFVNLTLRINAKWCGVSSQRDRSFSIGLKLEGDNVLAENLILTRIAKQKAAYTMGMKTARTLREALAPYANVKGKDGFFVHQMRPMGGGQYPPRIWSLDEHAP